MPLEIIISDEMQEIVRQKIKVCLVEMICLMAENLEGACRDNLIGDFMVFNSQYTMYYMSKL